MVYGILYMVYGIWCMYMVYGIRYMVYVYGWYMVHGILYAMWHAVCGIWYVVYGVINAYHMFHRPYDTRHDI